MRIGNVLIAAGAALVVIGALVRFGLFGWFGNLPGDIRTETDNARIFIPITSMIVISVVLTVLANLFGGWWREP